MSRSPSPQDESRQRIQSFFGRHAAHYAQSPSHRSGPDLDRLLEALDPGPGDVCLDIATGGGHAAVAMARRGRTVVGLDLTGEMGRECLASARAAGLVNVLAVTADAASLPFRDSSFDRVTCRRAVHHFADPAGSVAEAARVVRPGGRIGFTDMTVAEHEDAARLANAMETARDSSHGRALPPSEWEELAESAGLTILSRDEFLDRVPWKTWLAPVEPGGIEEERAVEALADADPHAAGQVVEEGPEGRIFLKRRIVLTARRP